MQVTMKSGIGREPVRLCDVVKGQAATCRER